jgi:hypothetical protein
VFLEHDGKDLGPRFGGGEEKESAPPLPPQLRREYLRRTISSTASEHFELIILWTSFDQDCIANIGALGHTD